MSNQKLIDEYRSNPAAFRRYLYVEVSGTVKRLGQIVEDWQAADFAAIDPGLKLSAGLLENSDSILKRVYLERARGHSKTTDLAIVCCWLLAFANRPLRGYAYAADKDQAGLLKDAMDMLIRLNPWLGQILDVQKDGVVN
jgi:hypothetical protein